MSTNLSVATWLKYAQEKLALAGIATARLDSLVLLGDMLNKNSAQLLATPGLPLTAAQSQALDRQLSRRSRHEPLAYIRGHTEFYGREFIITKHVLEPRPESETMIDLLKDILGHGINDPRKSSLKITTPAYSNSLSPTQRKQRRTMHLADIGTGSGALGITASLETGMAVDLFDIDPGALKVAQKNVIKFATQNRAMLGDLLLNAPTAYDILLCNLPYVPDNFYINPAALNEPRIAIFGGPDGLDIYRRLFLQVSSKSDRPKYILTESLPPQHTKLARIASNAGYMQTRVDDFIQVFEPVG